MLYLEAHPKLHAQRRRRYPDPHDRPFRGTLLSCLILAAGADVSPKRPQAPFLCVSSWCFGVTRVCALCG